MIDEDPTTFLVLAAQGGDRAALEGLFRRYLPRVRQIVALRLGCSLRGFADYEDVVQDALLNVFRKLDRFRTTSEGKFRYWLACCVANSVRTHLRRSAARKRSRFLPSFPYSSDGILEEVACGTGFNPQDLAEGEELAARIENALLTMKEPERQVIILDRLCGMTFREIRRVMRFKSEASVRRFLSRSLQRLRERLSRSVS